MDDDAPRARRRLRQRSDRAPPARDDSEREIIALDSSSDEFVASSRSQSDASGEESARGRRSGPRAKKPRGRKRLRQRGTTSSSDEGSSHTPTSTGPVHEPSASQAGEWECTRCTYLNEPQRLACELCLAARVTPKPTRKLSAWLTNAGAAPPTESSKATVKRREKTTLSQPVETIDSSDDGEPVKRERRRPRAKTSNDEESGVLWAEASHAQQIDELCVQKKKVQEVQEWLQHSVPTQVALRHGSMKRLLFLCGPPGSGKSTTVRHLASTMGVTIKEWRDNASAGKLQYHRYLRDEFQTTHVSAWDDFIDFINRSVNYSALQIAVLPDKRSRKDPPSRRQPSQSGSLAQGQLILIENWPLSPFGTSQDSAMWDEKLSAAFRQVVNPAANLQFPVVCIFSDVHDKKVDANQLAKVFSEEVVRSPFTSIINFNPVTAAQMKKTLVRTLEKLDCSISPQDLTKIIERSDGDMRHAINMAQLMQKRQTLKKTKRIDSKPKKVTAPEVNPSSDAEDEETSRDPFFSDFHVVGKLLHSKNIKLATSQSSGGSITESRLIEFDRILDSSAMPLDRVLSLLHSNCINYFTEIDDLGDALDLMSQSETWLHNAYRTTSSSAAFKTSHDVVRSVVVRSIALTNKNPAPSAFRPITAPRTYDTVRRMVSGRMESLFQQQEMTGGNTSSHPYLCRGDVYAFEIQPFVDTMRARTQHVHARQTGTSQDHNVGMHGVVSDQVLDDEIENSDGEGW